MAKFRCLECKKEFETDSASPDRKCPECMSRYLELVSGEIPRGKSWSAKSYSAR
ncbi:MAG: hydrogenase expression protein HypA/HybF [Synergistaceae bacterium]|nr:hydrogenase expression protein HypA/HybF [Synergistaceae bacterium]